jgi:hypothetical protein
VADMGLTVLCTADSLLHQYDQALEQIFARHKIKKSERMLNLHTLKTTVGVAKARQISRDFIKAIVSEIAEVTFCYSLFPTSKIPYTWIYTQDPIRKKISILKFVQMIQAGYALFAAHYRKKISPTLGVMLDHFDFPITQAWQEISTHSDVRVYVRGDLCNPRISLADLLLDLVECDIWRLNRQNALATLKSICPTAKVEAECLSNIDVMRPLTRTQTDLSTHMAHPIIFLAKEDLPGEGKMLETSPLMYAARNMACELGGCAKIFEAGPIDQRLIVSGDYFVHRGPVGKGVVKTLRTSGHDIVEWNQHDLLSKYGV